MFHHRSVRKEQKSRLLHPQLGADNHPRYNGASGQAARTDPIIKNRVNQDQMLSFYNAARRSENTTLVAGHYYDLGHEELNGVVNNRGMMNNCTHTKLVARVLPFLHVNVRYDRSDLATYHDYYRFATEGVFARWLGENLRSYAITQPGDDQQFSARAFWSMRPKFEGQVSIINSIFELKDFKDVLNLSGIVKTFRTMSSSKQMSSFRKAFNKLAREKNIPANVREVTGLKSYHDLSPGLMKRFARDLSGSAASAVLTYNLAYKPTISDAMAIAAQFASDTMEAQKEFALFGDDGALSHYSEPVTLQQNVVPNPKNNYFHGFGSVVKIQRTATMRSFYSYKIRSLNEALVKYWGLAGTVEALWNMLPLSFVLDYVLTIGKALSFMGRDNNVTNLTTEYCESVKISLSYGRHLIQDPRMLGLCIDGVVFPRTQSTKYHLVSGTQATRYTRKVLDAHKSPAFPYFRLPSNSQAQNLLALARSFLF